MTAVDQAPAMKNAPIGDEPFDWPLKLREAPTAAPRMTCEQAAKMLEQRPGAECVVVTDDRRVPVGLVMRDNFFRKLSSRFGASLYYEKPVTRLMDARPTIVDMLTPAQALLDLALGRSEQSLYDCVVVTDGGKLAGVLTVADLLTISRELQQLAAQSQARIITRAEDMIAGIDAAVAAARQASAEGERRSEMMVDLTLQGKNELTGVSSAFGSLSAQLLEQQEQIEELERRASAIGTVTTLIRELAEQCNLLAVNATIEAARAGEHGRGFAVVADEVRALASATKRSADDITGLIAGLTEAVRRTAELSKSGGREAEGSEAAVTSAALAFEQLFHAAADNRIGSRDIDAKAAQAHALIERVSAEIRSLGDRLQTAGRTAQAD